jgi:hypothetical protein
MDEKTGVDSVVYEHYRPVFRHPKSMDEPYPTRGLPDDLWLLRYCKPGKNKDGERYGGFTLEDSLAQDLLGDMQPHPKGGKTVCVVTLEDGETKLVGVAYCSWADNFNYKLGRDIARGRALAQLGG